MQVVGQKCNICDNNISIAKEGTWCANCKTISHRDCIKNAKFICPKCNGKFEEPEKHFIYLEQCPVCKIYSKEKEKTCNNCGASIFYETNDEYLKAKKRFKKEYHDYRISQIVGIIEILSAFIIGYVYITYITIPKIGPCGGTGLGFALLFIIAILPFLYILIKDGIKRCMNYKKFKR